MGKNIDLFWFICFSRVQFFVLKMYKKKTVNFKGFLKKKRPPFADAPPFGDQWKFELKLPLCWRTTFWWGMKIANHLFRLIDTLLRFTEIKTSLFLLMDPLLGSNGTGNYLLRLLALFVKRLIIAFGLF